jgi:hypothetical protein
MRFEIKIYILFFMEVSHKTSHLDK